MITQDIIALHLEGLSRAEIAKRLSVSPDKVLKVQRAQGIARPIGQTKQHKAGHPNRADAGLRRFGEDA